MAQIVALDELMNEKKVGILDVGLGNAGSVERMLRKAGGIGARITGPNDLTDVSGLIIPGVGSFDPAMSRIREAGFEQAIHKIIDNTDVPVLGICLGMHLLCNSSEEGNLNGLGVVNAKVRDMKRFASGLPTPNMGWREVVVTSQNPLIEEASEQRFYFVHSYYVDMTEKQFQIFQSSYGFDFCCGFQIGKVLGVQFHPEKSHKYGLNFFKKFVKML